MGTRFRDGDEKSEKEKNRKTNKIRIQYQQMTDEIDKIQTLRYRI